MIVALCAVAYFAAGFCSAAYRAYREPQMARDYYLSHGWTSLLASEGSNVKSFDYPACLVGHFLAWPLLLPAVLIGIALRGFHRRGCEAVARAIEVDRQRYIDQTEIDRIIREAKL